MRWIATTLCASCGAALLVAARALDGRWFERHVLLPWYYPWAPSWVSDTRIAAATCGVILLALAWPLGRGAARSTFAGWLRILLAVVLGDPKTNNRPFYVRVVEVPSTPVPSEGSGDTIRNPCHRGTASTERAKNDWSAHVRVDHARLKLAQPHVHLDKAMELPLSNRTG